MAYRVTKKTRSSLPCSVQNSPNTGSTSTIVKAGQVMRPMTQVSCSIQAASTTSFTTSSFTSSISSISSSMAFSSTSSQPIVVDAIPYAGEFQAPSYSSSSYSIITPAGSNSSFYSSSSSGVTSTSDSAPTSIVVVDYDPSATGQTPLPNEQPASRPNAHPLTLEEDEENKELVEKVEEVIDEQEEEDDLLNRVLEEEGEAISDHQESKQQLTSSYNPALKLFVCCRTVCLI